jgi:PAS domain S-box-containing protein
MTAVDPLGGKKVEPVTRQAYSEQAGQILECMSDAFCAVDAGWKFTYINKNAEKLWGIKREQLIGFELWAVMQDNSILTGRQELLHAMQKRKPFSFETYSPPLYITLEVDLYPAQDGGLTVYFRDISGRKIAEETQRKAEQMLHLAIDVTGIGFWRWDIKTDEVSTIYSSPRFPFEPQKLSFPESLASIHPDDRDRIYEEKKAAILTKKNHTSEYRRMLPNGDFVWLYTQGEIQFDQDGNPEQMVGINYDLTERKKLEQQAQLQKVTIELKNREQELMEMLDAASDGSWIVDIANKTKTVSQKWKERLGVGNSSEQAQYQQDLDAVHPDDLERITQEFRDILQNHDTKLVSEYRMKTVDQEYIWVRARGKITYAANGSPLKMYGSSTDITEYKNMEHQLIEKNRLIIDFFTNISHEFKTPLSIILLDLDLINVHLKQAKCEYRDKIDHNVAVMRQNAYRLLRLIINLLDVTKVDSGFMKARLYSTDIVELLRELVDSVSDYARSKEISVEFIEHCGIMNMPADGEKLERIMLNLLSNAIKHTPKGGHITVKLDTWANRVQIAVHDDGEGIPQNKQEIIFDRFRQASSSLTRSSEGSGIGLSLTKALVELLQGRIWFESTPGKGSEFFVELPVLDASKTVNTPVMDGMKMSSKVEMEFSDIILQ